MIAIATPILASRMVKMTPGRSGSSPSAAALAEEAAAGFAAGGGGGGETTVGPEGAGAGASVVLSCSQAGVFASAIVLVVLSLCNRKTPSAARLSNNIERVITKMIATLTAAARSHKRWERESRWKITRNAKRPKVMSVIVIVTFLTVGFGKEGWVNDVNKLAVSKLQIVL